jgi:hypothetical protein
MKTHRKGIIITNHTRENKTRKQNINGLYELLARVSPQKSNGLKIKCIRCKSINRV